MQLTRLDRFLREKFVHEIHVYSMRPPEEIPSGIHAEELPDIPGRRFRHRYIARNSKAADALIDTLKAHNQMFTTRIVDRNAWYVPFVAPKDNKSVTWWCAWVTLSVVGVLISLHGIRTLWSNPEVRKNVAEALQILQG